MPADIADEAPAPRCSFALSAERMVLQRLFECETCGFTLDSGRAICHGCMVTCHADHETNFALFARAYCDCGHGGCTLASESKDAAAACTSAGSNFEVDEKGRVGTTGTLGLDMKTRYFTGIFGDSDGQVVEGVREQCRTLVEHSKDTFWIAATAEPRTPLEELALMVFDHHTAVCDRLDRTRAGAEFWVQYKPRDQEAEDSGAGVVMHYDKDEAVAEAFSVGVHPLISTVTYLTTGGAPTVIFDNLASTETGIPLDSAELSGAVAGKHLAFDGRLLHGAPVELLGALRDPNPGPVRITFLVNIWIEHLPSQVKPLTDELVAALNAAWPAGATVEGVSFGEPVPIGHMRVDEANGTQCSLPFVTEAEGDENCLLVDMWCPRGALGTDRSPEDGPSTLRLMFGEGCEATLVEYGDDDDDDEASSGASDQDN